MKSFVNRDQGIGLNISTLETALYSLTTLSLTLLVSGCTWTKPLANHFALLKKDLFTKVYEKENDSSKLSNWKHDSTSMYFLKDFNDTVIIYINHKKAFENLINNQNYPNPKAVKGSEFSGLTYRISTKIKKPIIDIELKSQKRFIEFILEDDNFPFCDIDHSNGKWIISYRKHNYEIEIEIIKK